MRPIDLSLARQQIPDDLVRAVETEEKRLKQCRSNQERGKLIDDKRRVWSALKAYLGVVSQNKCWYCESMCALDDFCPVDHFRPKGSVAECTKHKGYWWLAFKLDNYRFSCSLCNSVTTQKYLLELPPKETKGGKGTRFPLIDEGTRAYEPHHPIHEEKVELLDPINPDDCVLLSFDFSGEAVPTLSEKANKEAHKRAETSIFTYHLHRGALVAERRRVMRQVRDEVTLADQARQRGNQEGWHEHFFAVRRLTGEKAPYSTAASVALKRLAESENVGETASRILNNQAV
jgi:hypothetical protein